MVACCMKQESESVTIPCVNVMPDQSPAAVTTCSADARDTKLMHVHDSTTSIANSELLNQAITLPTSSVQHQDGTAVIVLDHSKQCSSPTRPLPIPVLSPRKTSSNAQQPAQLVTDKTRRDPLSGYTSTKQGDIRPTVLQQQEHLQLLQSASVLGGDNAYDKSTCIKAKQPCDVNSSHATEINDTASLIACTQQRDGATAAPALSPAACHQATTQQAMLKAFAASLFKSGKLPLDKSQLRTAVAGLLSAKDGSAAAATNKLTPALQAVVQQSGILNQLQKIARPASPQSQANQAKSISRPDEVECRPVEELCKGTWLPQQPTQQQGQQQPQHQPESQQKNSLAPPMRLVPVGGHLIAQPLSVTSKPSKPCLETHRRQSSGVQQPAACRAQQLPHLASSSSISSQQVHASPSPTAASHKKLAAHVPPVNVPCKISRSGASSTPDVSKLTQTQRLQLIARIMHSQKISPAQLAAAIAAKQGTHPASPNVKSGQDAGPAAPKSDVSTQSQKPCSATQTLNTDVASMSSGCVSQQDRTVVTSALSNLQAAMQAAMQRQTNPDIPMNITPDAAGVLSRALQQRVSMLLQQQPTANTCPAATNATTNPPRQTRTETPTSDTSVTSTVPATTTNVPKTDGPALPPLTTAVTRTLPISKAGSPAPNMLPSLHSTTAVGKHSTVSSAEGLALKRLTQHLQQQALKRAATQSTDNVVLDRLPEMNATGTSRKKRGRELLSEHAAKKRSATVVKPTFVSRKRHEQHTQAAMAVDLPELSCMRPRSKSLPQHGSEQADGEPSDQLHHQYKQQAPDDQVMDQDIYEAGWIPDSMLAQSQEDDDMYMAARVMEQLKCGSMSTDSLDRGERHLSLEARPSNGSPKASSYLEKQHGVRDHDNCAIQCKSQIPGVGLHDEERACGLQNMAVDTALKDCANSAGHVQQQCREQQQKATRHCPGDMMATDADDANELMYQMLDRLRPLVVSLAKHGAPSPTQVWVAVQAMKQPELMKMSRAGLPYLEELYNYPEHHEECAQLLRIMLHLAQPVV